jgi:hypothetical protein
LGETTFNYMYRISGVNDNDLPRLGAVDPYNFVFNNPLLPYNGRPATDPMSWLAPNRLLSRYGWNETGWEKDPRIVMYVSGNPAGFNPDSSTVQRPDPSTGARNNAEVAEALFEWDADDGLENGQYDVYLDMGAYKDAFRDGDRGALQAANYTSLDILTNPDNSSGLLTALGRGLYGLRRAPDEFRNPPFAPPLPLPYYDVDHAGLLDPSFSGDLSVDAELFTDEDGDGKCWTLSAGESGPTWKNLNRGTESFGQKRGLTPAPDGYIYYTSVRVKNNYLALYLRNWSMPGRANRFLGLVLTPRDRTSGRINVNTVETRAYRDTDGNTRLFNALMGVPGVLFDEGQQYLTPDGSPTPPRLVDLGLTEPLEGAPVPLPALWPRGRDPNVESPNLFDRARLIEVGRPGTRPKWNFLEYPDRWDGRYYASLLELLGCDSEFDYGGTPLHPLTVKPPPVFSALGIPLNLQRYLQWYDEIATRFAKLSNLVTTRSDVFEILVTVQAGYGVDANNDGQINWRSNDEFIVTAEKKARSVYER